MSPEESDPPAHKRRVLLRPRLFAGLVALAERNDSDVAEEANRAVREFLERHNAWPPSGDLNAESPGS